MNNTYNILVGALLATLSPAVFAQAYVGVSFGQTKSEVDAGRISGDLASLGFLNANVSSDTSDSGGRVFAGYTVMKGLAVEASYAELGKTRWNAASTSPVAASFAASIKSKAYGVDLVASHDFNPQFSFFGRVGVARTEADGSFAAGGFAETSRSSVTKRNTGAVYGAGIGYNFAANMTARLEYTQYTRLGGDELGGRFDVGVASFGLLVRF